MSRPSKIAAIYLSSFIFYYLLLFFVIIYFFVSVGSQDFPNFTRFTAKYCLKTSQEQQEDNSTDICYLEYIYRPEQTLTQTQTPDLNLNPALKPLEMVQKTKSRFSRLCTSCLFKNKGNHDKKNNEKLAISLL